jgi:hypothetical protein
MFGSRVLRKIRLSGPKRDDVTGNWRRLHNEELRELDRSPSVLRMIKRNKMGGASSTCARTGAYRVLMRQRERVAPL